MHPYPELYIIPKQPFFKSCWVESKAFLKPG